MDSAGAKLRIPGLIFQDNEENFDKKLPKNLEDWKKVPTFASLLEIRPLIEMPQGTGFKGSFRPSGRWSVKNV